MNVFATKEYVDNYKKLLYANTNIERDAIPDLVIGQNVLVLSSGATWKFLGDNNWTLISDPNGIESGVTLKSPFKEWKIEIDDNGALYSRQIETNNMYIMAGQSNMNGYLSDITSFADIPNPNYDIKYIYDFTIGSENYSTNEIVPLQARLDGGFGPEMSFGNAIPSGSTIVKVSMGGTSIAENEGQDWNVDSPNELFDRLLARINIALSKTNNPRIKGFIWVQGESDTEDVFAQQYEANLQKIINTIKQEYGCYDMRTIIVRTLLNSTTTDRDSFQNIVRNAQAKICEENPNAFIVSIDDFQLNNINNSGGSGFGSHYLSKELVALGYRVAEELSAENIKYKYSFKNVTGSNLLLNNSIFSRVGYAPWKAYRESDGAEVNFFSGGANTWNAGISTSNTFDLENSLQSRAGILSCYKGAISATTPSAFVVSAPIASLVQYANTSPINIGRIKKISWYQGHQNNTGNNSPTYTNIMIKVAGNWIISEEEFTNTSLSSANDFKTLAELKELEFSLSAINWRNFNFAIGSSFSPNSNSGAIISSDLNSSDIITDFAFYFSNPLGSCIARLDHLTIEMQRL